MTEIKFPLKIEDDAIVDTDGEQMLITSFEFGWNMGDEEREELKYLLECINLGHQFKNMPKTKDSDLFTERGFSPPMPMTIVIQDKDKR